MYRAFVPVLLFSIFGKVVCDISRPIPPNFPVGTATLIKGTPVENETNSYFHINFLTGSPLEEGDIDFHMAVRFSQGVIAFNSFLLGVGQNWEQEIYRQDSPIQAGRPFEMKILAQPQGFAVYINGKNYADFFYRRPRIRIKYLQVVGSVNVSLISIAMMPHYAWPLTNGFPVGSTAVIKGTPYKDFTPPVFYVHLLPRSPFVDGDVDFHIRFSDEDTALNSFELSNWQREIRREGSPIKRGKPFEIRIVAEQSYLSIFIDGTHWENFAYRKPRERIKYLQIYGGVGLSLLSVDTKQFD